MLFMSFFSNFVETSELVEWEEIETKYLKGPFVKCLIFS